MSFQNKKLNEETELEEIRKGFEMFDVDGTGKIIPSEVKEAMDSMSMKEKNPFIYEVIESLCSEKQYKDNNNGISIDDLVNYVYQKVNDNETNLGLRQLFDAIKDPDTDTISMHTFIKLAKDYGDDDGMSEEDLRYLLEKTQLGGDSLTFDEFYTIMKGGESNSSKSNVSIRSSEPYNKKKSPLSNITSQELNNSKKDENNNEKEKENEINANYNEIEINTNDVNSRGIGTPDKSPLSINKDEYNYQNIKTVEETTTNNNMGVEPFEKGLNQIKLENEEDKKKETVKIEPTKVKEIHEVREVKEVKETNPVRKYNRFRRFEVSNNNKNNNNNKIVVEEKTTVTKNVYRTRRPVNLNNNEEKRDEKAENKKEAEAPRRYHRRYRENKISTNVGQ
jgi:Ca2+-binding EF-hand superfamily protein